MSPDKSQVFALRLTGRKFTKNAAEWIRRKFSIDGRFGRFGPQNAHAPFRNHSSAPTETLRSPSLRIRRRGAGKKLRQISHQAGERDGLSVRLMSL
jgi:hypothetical protein